MAPQAILPRRANRDGHTARELAQEPAVPLDRLSRLVQDARCRWSLDTYAEVIDLATAVAEADKARLQAFWDKSMTILDRAIKKAA